MSPEIQRHRSGLKTYRWEKLPREKLLDLRIRDLDLKLEGTWVEESVEDLYQELEERGITLRPHVWLSHDWFSPDGVPGIAIPYYLAHPKLIRLERSQMLEVEGGTREECLRILRHETGHALQHAYRLEQSRGWQARFGRSSRRYPVSYRPDPASRDFVQHLRMYYAQSHPDEDFAETFAVWLQPRSIWKRRYEGWPALKKLEYVDELMAKIGGTKPAVRSRLRVDPVGRIRTTLRQYYAEKQKLYSIRVPDSYDRELQRLFSDAPRQAGRESAARFLRRHRKEIRQTVARWTGEYEFTLDQVLREMIARARELKLRAAGPERRLVHDFSGLLALQSVHSLYSRHVSIPL